MTYVENSDGGFESMPDTAQRVLMLVALGVDEAPIIDSRYQAIMGARIRKELEILTRGPEPAIQLIDVVVGDNKKSSTTKTIVFRDLKSGTTQTVQAN